MRPRSAAPGWRPPSGYSPRWVARGRFRAASRISPCRSGTISAPARRSSPPSGSSCYQLSPGGDSCLGADSFGATFLELGFAYGFGIAPRTTLSAKVLGGFTDLSPGPVQSHGAVPDHVPGVHAGAGVALDYSTRLDHFAVGIDAVFRETFARYSLRLPSLAVMPRVRYVF